MRHIRDWITWKMAALAPPVLVSLFGLFWFLYATVYGYLDRGALLILLVGAALTVVTEMAWRMTSSVRYVGRVMALLLLAPAVMGMSPTGLPYLPVLNFWTIPDHWKLPTDVDDAASFQRATYATCNTNSSGATGGKVMLLARPYTLSTQVVFPCNGTTFDGMNNGWVDSGNLDYRGTVLVLETPANTSAFKSGMVSQDYGGGIHFRHLAIDGDAMPSTSTVFDFSWLKYSSSEDVNVRNVYNFFREEGGGGNVLQDVSVFGLKSGGVGVLVWGDASNCGTNNTAISLAACPTRGDLLRVTRVTLLELDGQHGATCFEHNNFFQSLDLEETVCESVLVGYQASCDVSQGNNGEACPAFDRWVNAEFEDNVRAVNASDVQDISILGGYMLGTGTLTTSSALSGANSVVASFYNTNYGGNPTTASAGPYPQGIRIIGSRIANAGGACLQIGVSAFIISQNQIAICNLGDTNKTVGAPAIDVEGTFGGPTGTMPERGVINDNLLCSMSGQQSANLFMGGIWLGADTNYMHVHDNVTVGCVGGNTATAQGNGITVFTTKTGVDVHNN